MRGRDERRRRSTAPSSQLAPEGISVDAAVETRLAELDNISSLEEPQKMDTKGFSRLLTGSGHTLMKHRPALRLATGR